MSGYFDDAGNFIESAADSGMSLLNSLATKVNDYAPSSIKQGTLFGTFKNAVGSAYDYTKGALKDFKAWGSETTGTGKDAKSNFQLGLEGLSALMNYIGQDRALKESQKQFEYQKDLSRANYLNNGANVLNQHTWQLENLNAFNPEAAAERANNLQPMVNQMNQAASTLGAGSDAFNQQAQTIAKYSTLKPTVNS